MLTLDPTLKKKIGWGATDPNPKRNMVMDINRTTGSIHLHGVAGLGGGGITVHKGFEKFVFYSIKNGCLGGIPPFPPSMDNYDWIPPRREFIEPNEDDISWLTGSHPEENLERQ